MSRSPIYDGGGGGGGAPSRCAGGIPVGMGGGASDCHDPGGMSGVGPDDPLLPFHEGIPTGPVPGAIGCWGTPGGGGGG